MLRSMFKGHHTRADPAPSRVEEEAEEAADSLGSLPSTSSSFASTSSSMAPPKLIPRKSSRKDTNGKGLADDTGFSPISAADCFQDAFQVQIEEQGSFRVYFTPPKPISRAPIGPPTSAKVTELGKGKDGCLLTISSDSALDSIELPSVASDEEEEPHSSAQPARDPGTLFFFHHGAGFSGLSFALAAREITRLTTGEAGVMAIDSRGHGRTTHPSSVSLPLDMSLDRLVQDCVQVLLALYPQSEQMPKLLLVGHSMGGSVVTALCTSLQSLTPPIKIAGVAVLDVVEGTALDALEGMRGIILSHPKGFHSVQAAIRWHVDTGSIHNLESARRSVPSLLMENLNFNREHRANIKNVEEEPMEELTESVFSTTSARLEEEDFTSYPLVWRADLLATQEHWPGWFQGLSKRFLSVRTARLLLLAGTDRLDKELMVGQMQGKYQLTVLPEVGHCLQEDAPEKTARILVDFWRRNEVVPGRLGIQLNKVGDI